MKNAILPIVGLAMILAFGCKQGTPIPEKAPAPSKTAFTTTGPDVDLLKKLMESFASGDWATYRSCFSDTAVTYYNNWPLDKGAAAVPVDSVVANHKAGRAELWDGMSINQPIYEVVTDSSGNKYGHVWAKLSTKKRKKAGEPVDVTVFGSYLLKDGKIQYEWVIFDRTPLN